MNIIVTNDGKEKYNSFEATAEISCFAFEGWVTNFDVVGLGATEEEARENFSRILAGLRAKLDEN